jgi:hypothetical protein
MLTLTRKDFMRRFAKDPAFGRRCDNATSPGPVAGRLKVSRQYVHKLLDEGKLDGVRVLKPDGSTAMVLIFTDSVDAFVRGRTAAA